MHILDKIVRTKQEEVKLQKTRLAIADLEKKIDELISTKRPFASAIRDSQTGIIAEFKRRSPSKPSINPTALSKSIVPEYAKSGAAAISILTDQNYFGGSIQDIIGTRDLVNTPILRKEFIIDEYQIYESAAAGADAILLIAEILTKEQIHSFCSTAHNLKLEVLMELHHAEELEKFSDAVDVIGVNNRNLKSFQTDINYSIKLFDKLPKETVKISESGLHDPQDLRTLIDLGYDGFLIGERFMKTNDPALSLKNFIDELSHSNEN